MKVFKCSEARRRLASLLGKAVSEVRIRRKDGKLFALRPEPRSGSPLDVEPMDLGVSAEEIVDFVRESRRTA